MLKPQYSLRLQLSQLLSLLIFGVTGVVGCVSRLIVAWFGVADDSMCMDYYGEDRGSLPFFL